MLIIFAVVSILFIIHMLVLLLNFLKKDSNYNRNIRLKGGHIVGIGHGMQYELLDNGQNNEETIVKSMRNMHPPVTSSFAFVYIRLHELNTNMNYDIYLDSKIMIGRVGGDADIQLNDRMVSLRHCMLYRKGEEIFLQDLGSTNRTYLNNCMLECPMPLAFGDIIAIGQNCFSFQFYNV